MNKICTSIEQSKKLAEFLPIESADMYWDYDYSIYTGEYKYYPMVMDDRFDDVCIPCWSLVALFSMLPKSAYLEKGSSTELCRVTLPVELISSDWSLEPIDACVEVVLKLHEQKLL